MARRTGLLAVLLICCAVDALAASVPSPSASGHEKSAKIHLAQTSAVTTCLMTCNSQAAACATTCLIPGTPPTGAATTTSNANLNMACQVNCSIQRISCQTTCAQTAPSQ
jgi:hypothetical protein